jgi:hypothetical protein
MSNDQQRDLIAANVRAEVARQGRRHNDAAAALGIHKANLSRRMRGEVAFRADELARLADWLGVPIAVLVRPDNVTEVAV